MRIFNNRGTNLELPLGNGQKISVLPYGVSADFLPSTNFLVMIASTFGFDELSIVVNGVSEMNLCSSVSTCNGFVVYSVAEAMERLHELQNKEKTVIDVNKAQLKNEEKVEKKKKKDEKTLEETINQESTQNPSNS